METTTVEISLRKAIANALPGVAIRSIEAAPSPGIHRAYRAALQDGRSILCSLPPPCNRRLLRFEFASIRSEAAVLQWLGGLCQRRQTSSSSSDAGAVDFEEKKEEKNRASARFLSDHVLELLEHGSAAMPQPVPYNLSIPPPGAVLSSLPRALTPAQRKSVDFQIGRMMGSISLLQSPTCRFGYAESIVPPVPERSGWAQRRISVQHSSDTYTRWSEAFDDMLNDAIQDAQLNQITAAYDSIRRLFRHFTQVLDVVVEPRLVIMSAGLDTNVLVSPQSDACSPDNDDDADVSSDDESPSSGTESSQSTSASSADEAAIKVTGLQEWTRAIFGDPFIAAVFCSDPSEHLLRGFNTRPSGAAGSMDGEGDLGGARGFQIRQNLYRIYHALNAISVEYIRRDEGSDPRELKARKALVEAIRELESVEDETLKRRRPRIELPPSKRPRISIP